MHVSSTRPGMSMARIDKQTVHQLPANGGWRREEMSSINLMWCIHVHRCLSSCVILVKSAKSADTVFLKASKSTDTVFLKALLSTRNHVSVESKPWVSSQSFSCNMQQTGGRKAEASHDILACTRTLFVKKHMGDTTSSHRYRVHFYLKDISKKGTRFLLHSSSFWTCHAIHPRTTSHPQHRCYNHC